MSRVFTGPLYRLEINTREIEDALVEAFAVTNEMAKAQFDRAIESHWYPWPRVTKRRRGEAGSPRNIVDMGQLLGSHVGNKVSPTVYAHFWTAEYALYVHEGARLSNGTVLPARRWTEEAFKRWSFAEAFALSAETILERRLP